MTVAELIEKLQELPQDYIVTFESGDAYGSGYSVVADDVEVKHKDREIEIKEW